MAELKSNLCYNLKFNFKDNVCSDNFKNIIPEYALLELNKELN